MSSVNNVDVTAVQTLIDVRNQLDRYAAPQTVEWHFASINNRWTKRALASAGFGLPKDTPTEVDGSFHRWKPIFSVAEIGGHESAAAYEQWEHNRAELKRGNSYHNGAEDDIERKGSQPGYEISKQLSRAKEEIVAKNSKVAVIHGVNRPLFHADLTSALQSAIHNYEAMTAYTAKLEETRVTTPESDGLDSGRKVAFN